MTNHRWDLWNVICHPDTIIMFNTSGIRVIVPPMDGPSPIPQHEPIRLCNMCVCTTLTHACEEWNLTKAVSRILNGLNSRCLPVRVITGEEYRDTGIS